LGLSTKHWHDSLWYHTELCGILAVYVAAIYSRKEDTNSEATILTPEQWHDFGRRGSKASLPLSGAWLYYILHPP
jgi:hypothetical protein